MTETERITVAEASEGFGGSAETGTEISLPVVELLTGRGFVTGKSGSGKSNSASVIAEKLLDNGFGLLIVDIDGEYYGLKEEYEILHAGADEECDIQITADHAEKLASLALEQNVPIILDVSSYLDESEAAEILTAVARSLFAKAKKQKQPFLLLVEEVHEYIPENGSVGECGRMLIKIGKRGRKHGLGICGISQRPADVKKDFITQCDWLLWHRLTWNNDTKVVGRILDNEYAGAVEDLDDGEGFLMTDWMDSIERVQFYRKQTFDAGATPGLDDFERPDLKSVSDNLVSELQEISEERQQTENRITELREELDRKNSRIAELERELQDARDLSRMAEQFVDSLVKEVNGAQPGKTERQRMRESYADAGSRNAENGAVIHGPRPDESDAGQVEATPDPETERVDSEPDSPTDGLADFGEAFASGVVDEETGESETPPDDSDSAQDDDSNWAATGTESTEVASTDGGAIDGESAAGSDFSADAVLEALNSVTEMSNEPKSAPRGTAREQIERSIRNDAEIVEDDWEPSVADDEEITIETDGSTPLVVRELKADIADLPTKSRKMLSYYREMGPGTPLNAHFAAGGDGSRTEAYAHNRQLRTRGLIEHVGRGHYCYRLRDLLAEQFEEGSRDVSEEDIEEYADDIERTVLSD